MRLTITGLAIIATSSAYAACTAETLISCPIGSGKHLEVCIEPEGAEGEAQFTYTFGPKNRPELNLAVPMSAGTVTPWSGVGGAIWSTVSFPSKGFEYEVWHSFDRSDEEEADLQGGVTVRRGEALIAELSCNGGEIAPMFTLEDSMEQAGFCWNSDESKWHRACG